MQGWVSFKGRGKVAPAWSLWGKRSGAGHRESTRVHPSFQGAPACSSAPPAKQPVASGMRISQEVLGRETTRHEQLGNPLAAKEQSPPGLRAQGPLALLCQGRQPLREGVTLLLTAGPAPLACSSLAQQLPFCGQEERGW